MKIHTPNAESASGPTMYGARGNVPITNLPLFLTVYETTIEDERGRVVWSAFSLKPVNADGRRRLSIQLRCYLFEEGDEFVVRCRFGPNDPVYAQYMLTVPWSSASADGYVTIGNHDTVWDASDHISFVYDSVTNVLRLFVRSSVPVDNGTVFVNASI